MKAKVLSVYNHYYEIKDFLFKYDFIDETQLNDDEYDLLTWLEGDCDSLKMDGDTIYFGHFHSDYKWDDCFVVITTAEWQAEIDEVENFFNGDEWVGVPDDDNFDLDAFLESDVDPVHYRGGVGPVYAIYCRKDADLAQFLQYILTENQ